MIIRTRSTPAGSPSRSTNQASGSRAAHVARWVLGAGLLEVFLPKAAFADGDLLSDLRSALRVGVSVDGRNAFAKAKVEALNQWHDPFQRLDLSIQFDPRFGRDQLPRGITYLGEWNANAKKAAPDGGLRFVAVLVKLKSEEGQSRAGNYSNAELRVHLKYQGAKASSVVRLIDLSDPDRPFAEWNEEVDLTSAPGLVFAKEGEKRKTKTVTRMDALLQVAARAAESAMREAMHACLLSHRADLVASIAGMTSGDGLVFWTLAGHAHSRSSKVGVDAELREAMKKRLVAKSQRLKADATPSSGKLRLCRFCGKARLVVACCDDLKELTAMSPIVRSLFQLPRNPDPAEFPDGWPLL
jgi:hypothetical protein